MFSFCSYKHLHSQTDRLMGISNQISSLINTNNKNIANNVLTFIIEEGEIKKYNYRSWNIDEDTLWTFIEICLNWCSSSCDLGRTKSGSIVWRLWLEFDNTNPPWVWQYESYLSFDFCPKLWMRWISYLILRYIKTLCTNIKQHINISII